MIFEQAKELLRGLQEQSGEEAELGIFIHVTGDQNMAIQIATDLAAEIGAQPIHRSRGKATWINVDFKQIHVAIFYPAGKESESA